MVVRLTKVKKKKVKKNIIIINQFNISKKKIKSLISLLISIKPIKPGKQKIKILANRIKNILIKNIY